MELVPGVHRIEAQAGGRPLYLFAFLGERQLLLDAGCASTIDEFVVPFLDGVGLGVGVNQQIDPPWPDELAQELVYSVHGHAEGLVALGLATSTRGADGRLIYQVCQ